MKLARILRSLKARIVVSYSLILIAGGLAMSAIGLGVAERVLLREARQQVEHGLSAARVIYDGRLEQVRQCVELLAEGGRLRATLAAGEPAAIADYLARVRQRSRLDFLSVASANGDVLFRAARPEHAGGSVAALAPIAQALRGQSAASTEIAPEAILEAEATGLAERVRIRLVHTPMARPREEESLRDGMTLLAAAPVRDDAGRIIGVVYAGQLLSNPDTDPAADSGHAIVDKIKATLFPSLQYEGRSVGTATIFQDDVRISTNVLTAEGRRAIGTRISREVYDAVMGAGRRWTDRAFVVHAWYITAYEPIVNLVGERIGVLYVGLLERPYVAVRHQLALIFAAIGAFCFALIVVVTWFLTRSLVRPLEDMAAVSRAIAGGDLSRRVRVTDQSELGELGHSFNTMLDRINEMKTELEEWTRTLERKVEERTQQLVKVQTEMTRAERLASLGRLSAGVAHEINNPLGGILTFASLVLEQLPVDSPYRGDVEEVVNQALRCRKIVTGLLEFSRQREPNRLPGDLNEVVTQTLALLERQALFHDIQIVRRLEPELPPVVIDASQMQQVFMNIILNAVDGMEQRGTLTIETGQDRDKRQLFARFADTGGGVPKEHLARVFDPFFTTKDPGRGTGLGLSVSYGIVTSHGGRITVESEVGKGSTFTVILPAEGESGGAVPPSTDAGGRAVTDGPGAW